MMRWFRITGGSDMKKYTCEDYRLACNELQNQKYGTEGFKLARMKLRSIMEAMLRDVNTSSSMSYEVEDDLSQMNDNAIPYSDAEVQFLLWLLDETGHKGTAYEIREWDWL